MTADSGDEKEISSMKISKIKRKFKVKWYFVSLFAVSLSGDVNQWKQRIKMKLSCLERGLGYRSIFVVYKILKEIQLNSPRQQKWRNDHNVEDESYLETQSKHADMKGVSKGNKREMMEKKLSSSSQKKFSSMTRGRSNDPSKLRTQQSKTRNNHLLFCVTNDKCHFFSWSRRQAWIVVVCLDRLEIKKLQTTTERNSFKSMAKYFVHLFLLSNLHAVSILIIPFLCILYRVYSWLSVHYSASLCFWVKWCTKREMMQFQIKKDNHCCFLDHSQDTLKTDHKKRSENSHLFVFKDLLKKISVAYSHLKSYAGETNTKQYRNIIFCTHCMLSQEDEDDEDQKEKLKKIKSIGWDYRSWIEWDGQVSLSVTKTMNERWEEVKE